MVGGVNREDYGLWVLSSLGMKVIIQIHFSLAANQEIMDFD